MFNKFYKKSIRARIVMSCHNHMPPVTSNHGGNLPDREATTVEKKGFHMAPLLSSYHIGAIYTINFKNGLFRPFKTILRRIGQAGPDNTREG